MPFFRRRRRRSPIRRVRLAWLLAGAFLAVARGDWTTALRRLDGVYTVLRREIVRDALEA